MAEATHLPALQWSSERGSKDAGMWLCPPGELVTSILENLSDSISGEGMKQAGKQYSK